VPVCAHDAVAAKPHVNTSKALGKDAFKRNEVGGLFEDAQSAVGAVDDVINNAAGTLSFGICHNSKVKQKR